MNTPANPTSRLERRAISRQARDTFPPMGIYAVRALESGYLLIGASKQVHAALNRIRFELRMGSCTDRVLQSHWNQSGADGFTFEILDLLKEREDPDFDYTAELKALEHIHRELQGLIP